jgi:hypothetical protein
MLRATFIRTSAPDFTPLHVTFEKPSPKIHKQTRRENHIIRISDGFLLETSSVSNLPNDPTYSGQIKHIYCITTWQSFPNPIVKLVIGIGPISLLEA